ncbi:hypothetical protein L248_1648 [Schleiferilactobacillus shenzhenensis LY-73]|uniref:IrrE N-terminal-like domain-containing protein n=1 Tax=Schleiferilactobacillus shenzhenensis LY-73 TaxID=1231336 RepID=U4TGT9_9LACO|nr:hypothetical protein L248_1648 [Schleiferilactobacillus shenzhenensis LY-73]
MLNSNWYQRNALPMHAAHEISHILNGDEGVLYYRNYYSKAGAEGAANRSAIKILVPLYFADVEPEDASSVQFVDALCIPGNLQDWIEEEIRRFYA